MHFVQRAHRVAHALRAGTVWINAYRAVGFTAPFGGYKYRLVDFEKVPLQHVLSIQKDPGKIPFYVGGLMLILTLGSVFFFSHQRVWALVEKRAEGGCEVVLGGNSNRNKLGFEDRFNKLVGAIGGKTSEV